MGFQVSPGIMSMDTLLQKLYPPERGPYMFRRGPGVSGLGCNPGETRNVSGGGQEVCGDDGKSWSAVAAATLPAPTGPYSSDQANRDFQLQQQQSGGADLTPIYNPPTGYTPGGPGEPNCTISAGGLTWVDNACVAAQSARSIANQDAVAKATDAFNLQRCLDNNTDPAVCASRYPGVTPSGNLGPGGQPLGPAPVDTPPAKPNQSVPPTTPLVPMTTGFQKTGQVVAQQLGQGAANPPASNPPATGSGDTLLIVAAVGVGLFLLMKGGKG